jgi:hypothetical protein
MAETNLEDKLKNAKSTKEDISRMYSNTELDAMIYAYYINHLSLREIGRVVNEETPLHPQAVKFHMNRRLIAIGLEAYLLNQSK